MEGEYCDDDTVVFIAPKSEAGGTSGLFRPLGRGGALGVIRLGLFWVWACKRFGCVVQDLSSNSIWPLVTALGHGAFSFRAQCCSFSTGSGLQGLCLSPKPSDRSMVCVSKPELFLSSRSWQHA